MGILYQKIRSSWDKPQDGEHVNIIYDHLCSKNPNQQLFCTEGQLLRKDPQVISSSWRGGRHTCIIINLPFLTASSICKNFNFLLIYEIISNILIDYYYLEKSY